MTTHKNSLLYVAVALSFAAELLHLWELPGLFELWWAYGIFVLIAAMAQGAGAVLLLFWPRFWMMIAGIAGNIFLILVSILVRVYGDYVTLNLPPLPFEIFNLIIAIVQLIIIVLLAMLLWQDVRASRGKQPPTAGQKQKVARSMAPHG